MSSVTRRDRRGSRAPRRISSFGEGDLALHLAQGLACVDDGEVADHRVVAVAALHDVVGWAADELVVAIVAADGVGAGLARGEVVAGAGADPVGAVLAADAVVAAAAGDRVVTAWDVHATTLA